MFVPELVLEGSPLQHEVDVIKDGPALEDFHALPQRLLFDPLATGYPPTGEMLVFPTALEATYRARHALPVAVYVTRAADGAGPLPI